jgi:benzoyl-CoA reductase/2-hydroxyglutaryl-CoA dehydratase subunit BcrC/BadD/HgdB
VKTKLESVAGKPITNESLKSSINVYNDSRAVRREFVKLAGEHPEAVSVASRSAVLKSAFFMLKEEHTALLRELNAELAKAPKAAWKGIKVLTSGIIADGAGLLKVFDDLRIAIAADDVAQESRAIRADVPVDSDPMTALARQFAAQDQDPLLYDPAIDTRPAHVVELVKKSGAQGVVVLMMTFCDPEELEWPSLKQALDAAKIPVISIGYDQQMKDFAQARTQIQAFADILGAA